MEKTKKKEKPTPKSCVCGREAIIVKARPGKMVTCPAPTKCTANLRTTWQKSEPLAIAEWNNLVDAFIYNERTMGR